MTHPNVPGLPPLAELDVDGAIQETAAAVDGDTRSAFLRKAGVAGGALLAGGAFMGAVPKLALGQSFPKSDVDILNFALTLEYLEAAFYTEAVGKKALDGTVQSLAELLASHENTHVKTLKKVLGSKAVKKPKFDFRDTTTNSDMFLATSLELENTGVHAYLGLAGKIKTPALLGTAATIVTVEARHAAAVSLVAGRELKSKKDGITPDGPFDKPLSKGAIIKLIMNPKTTFFVK